jgi:PHD finger protein 12 MRG binding domain/PHD-finger
MKEKIAKEKEEILRAQEDQENARAELERIRQQEEQVKLDLEKTIEEEAKAKEEAEKTPTVENMETSVVIEEALKTESDPPITAVEETFESEISGEIADCVVKEEKDLITASNLTPTPEAKPELMLIDVEPGVEPVQEIPDEQVKEPEVSIEVPEDPEAPELPKQEEEVEIIPDKEEDLTPLQELIRVARLLNPKQFELPPEMIEPFPFPGTERAEIIKNGRRVKNKRLVELDVHGCVPLPAKLCYACSKTCKKAPLISCDYCSLFFHQDCLDPPLTALPAGRWMCPNHPQHFIVSNLLWHIWFFLTFN